MRSLMIARYNGTCKGCEHKIAKGVRIYWSESTVYSRTHKYAGTDDHAYHWDPKFATLSTKDALDNADSHAWFCIDVR